MNFWDDIISYLDTTPQKEIERVWAKYDDFDDVGPTVDEFMKTSYNE